MRLIGLIKRKFNFAAAVVALLLLDDVVELYTNTRHGGISDSFQLHSSSSNPDKKCVFVERRLICCWSLCDVLQFGGISLDISHNQGPSIQCVGLDGHA